MNFRNIIILFCFPILLKAQGGFKIRHFIPNALTNLSRAIFETTSGNYIAAGMIVDSVNGNYINRLTLMGLDQNGQVLWHKKYGNAQWEYLTGYVSRSFYRYGNFLYHTCGVLDSNGKVNGVLLKFNFNGDTVWQKVYRDIDGVGPQMVTKSVDGGFLITGYFVVGNPGLLIKTDANGNELWRKKITKITPSVLDGKAIVQDSSSKKIVIVGYQYTGLASDPDINDNVLILDSLGNKLHQLHYTSFGGVLNDLVQTRDSNFIAIGYQYYPQTIGGNHLSKSFAVKFGLNDPSQPIWKIDGFDKLGLDNVFSCLKELPNGDILIAGLADTIYGTIGAPNNTPENTLNRFTIITTNGIIKKNSYYNYKTNDPSESNSQGISSIELCQDGGWVAAIGMNNTSPNPFFFIKYDSTGCDSSAAHCATLNLVGTDKWKTENGKWKMYPSPVKDFLTIETRLADEVEVGILDILGREVKRIIITQNAKVDVRDLEDGIYLVTIRRNNEIISKTKIIKE